MSIKLTPAITLSIFLILFNSCKQSFDESNNAFGYKGKVKNIKILSYNGSDMTMEALEYSSSVKNREILKPDSVLEFNLDGSISYIEEFDSLNNLISKDIYVYNQNREVKEKKILADKWSSIVKYSYDPSGKLETIKSYDLDGQHKRTSFIRWDSLGRESEKFYYFRGHKNEFQLSCSEEYIYTITGNYLLKTLDNWTKISPLDTTISYYNKEGQILESGYRYEVVFEMKGSRSQSDVKYNKKSILMGIVGYVGAEIYEYNQNNGLLIKKMIVFKDKSRNNEMYIHKTTEYEYDSNGLLIRETHRPHIEFLGPIKIITYSYEFDRYMNWIKKTKSVNGKAETISLKHITYYE